MPKYDSPFDPALQEAHPLDQFMYGVLPLSRLFLASGLVKADITLEQFDARVKQLRQQAYPDEAESEQ